MCVQFPGPPTQEEKKANNRTNSHPYLNNGYKQTLNLGNCRTTHFY